MILYKQTAQEIKDMDAKKGIVIAYANAYNNEDSDGDMSMPGCFTKTIAENFKRIRVLKDHNSTISLGVPMEMNPNDPHGLLTTTQFNMNKEVSRDMFTDIQLYMENKLNAELSIGYQVMKRDASDKRKITEYKLYEYSFLTSWAANELATVQGVKNLKSTQGIMELLTKAYKLDYSDTRLKQIEKILKSLDNNEAADPGTLEKSQPNTSLIKGLTDLNNLLKT